MANISAIKLPDGVTYDIVDRVSGSDIFVATYGSTTYADISSAIDAGKSIWVNNQGGYLPLVYDGRNRQDGHIFCGVIGDMGSTNMLGYGCCASNNNWSMRAFTPQEVLTSGTNIKTINNTSILGSGNISTPAKNVWYGTCSTTSSIQQKSVTTLSGDFALDEGNILLVEFASTNSYDGATLSVDELTAKAIYVNGSPTNDHRWRAGEVVIFVYDGYHFNLIEQGTATTSYYGITKLSSSTSSTSELIAATPKAVKAAYDEAIDAKATPTANKKSKFDASAHMNSTDMTTAQVDDFVDGLNVSGGGVVKTNVTPTSGTNYSGYGNCYYEVLGKLVHFHIGIGGLTANTSTKIYTMPLGLRPQTKIFAKGSGGSSLNYSGIELWDNGEIYVTSQSTYCGAELWYFV